MFRIRKIIEQNPKKFKKVLIFSLLVLFLVALLFSPNVAFADWASWLLENDLYAREVSQIIDIVSHIVYVFIWPCLAIAGTALDNSLIYGSFLHLDAALWNIWNIMKNFANFTLWFVFIFTIVRNLFAWSFGDSKYDPVKWARDTIVKTLIAGVLVQMSWFVVAALIDLSTILIYAVWWIPLSMLWSYGESKLVETPIMKLNTEFDTNNVSYYYSYSWRDFSPCFLVNKGWDVNDNVSLAPLGDDEYIAWRKILYKSISNDEWITFETWYCVLNGYLYKYEETPWFFCDLPWWVPGTWCYEKSWNTISLANQNYLYRLKQYLINSDTWGKESLRDSCFLINAYNIDYKSWSCEPICIGSGYWEVSYTGDFFEWWFKLKDLMENSKWWVWPFVTMYSSILNYQDLVINPWNESVAWNLFGFLINTFFAVVLFIPVAILMVLLIIRIWYLWVVVAISPILILINFGPLWDKLKNNELLKKFAPKEVIRQIFSPIIVVFTVSLCIVFLSTIYKTKPNYEDESVTLSAFWIEKVGTDSALWNTGNWNNTGCLASWHKNVRDETYSILWLVTVKLNAQNYNHWKSLFARVLVELLATGMVRFFMKFAISAMWDRWKNLMKSAEDFVKSVPIIPLPGKNWAVGINKLKEMWPAAVLSRFGNDMDAESEKNLRKAFPWAFPWWRGGASQSETTPSSVSTESIESVVAEIERGWWAWKVKYENLSDTSKSTLTAIYWSAAAAATNLNNFTSYYMNTSYTNIVQAGKDHWWTPTEWKTNADAVRFTDADMNMAVKNDPNWKAWARQMVWGSVQLANWVFMVDYIKWTETTNPEYRIISREQYEKDHFGNNTIENVSKTYYETHQKIVDDYLKELQEELTELKRITDIAESERTQKDKDRLASLNQLGITQQELDDIKTALGINW